MSILKNNEFVDILQLKRCIVALIVIYLDTRFKSIALLSFYSFIKVLITRNQIAKIDKYIKLLTGSSKTLIKFHSSRNLFFFFFFLQLWFRALRKQVLYYEIHDKVHLVSSVKDFKEKKKEGRKFA